MSAKTPQSIREQIVTLRKSGHSTRSIETILAKRGVTVGKSTIASVAKQHRSSGAPAPRSTRASSSTASPVLGGTLLRQQVAAAQDAAEGHLPPELAGLDPLAIPDMDLHQLAAIAALLDTASRSAVREKDARLAGQLWDLREKVSRAIARLRPPVLPDPAKDPANTAARDEIRARLMKLVHSARKSDAGLALLRAHLEVAERAKAQRDAEALAQ
jgi:hypothetical protein